jgi:hypothetical protein
MSLVVYNQLHAKPTELPDYWVTIHESAAAASLFAGATTYSLAHFAGRAMTFATTSSISIAGLILAEGTRLAAGDTACSKIMTNTRVAADVVGKAGESLTQTSAILTSSLVAATVGSSFLVGKMVQNIVRTVRQKACNDAPVILLDDDKEDHEFAVYDMEEQTVSEKE